MAADSDSFASVSGLGGAGSARDRVDPAFLTLTQAYEFAARAHAPQKRKGANYADYPYVNHLCEVAALAAEATANLDVLVAATLHDVVEDRHATLEEIRARFGDRVAELVAALTDKPEWELLTTAERKRMQAETLSAKPPEAKIVKLADQISNLRARAKALDRWSPLRLHAYLRSCQVVADACRGASPRLDHLFAEAAAELAEALKTLPPLSAAEQEALNRMEA